MTGSACAGGGAEGQGLLTLLTLCTNFTYSVQEVAQKGKDFELKNAKIEIYEMFFV
jgi:hypothetical protein